MNFIIILIIGISLNCQAQYQTISITRKKLDSQVPAVTDAVADSTLKIVTYVFNSKEFQDTLSKLVFPSSNTCVECSASKDDPNKKITGKDVLVKLFAHKNVELKLLLKPKKATWPGSCGSLGYTCPDTDFITSHYKNINCLMGSDLPFIHAYAVHICHEFMHNIGYCHTDHSNTDIAEEVGNIVFDYVVKWRKAGRL